MADTATLKKDLFIPEVIGDMVDQKLTDRIAFGDIVEIDDTLVGVPGDTITVPKYEYIGDADDVAENEEIPLDLLQSNTTTATVKKAGKGVGITDEAAGAGYGDPVGNATRQIRTSIAQKVDNDVLDSLGTVRPGMTVGDGSEPISADFIANALVKFGEDIETENGESIVMVGYIAPSQLSQIRRDKDFVPPSEIAADIRIRGTVGMIHGVQLKVRNKIKAKSGKITGYIAIKGAVKVLLKRDTNVEVDRITKRQRTDIYGVKHYTTWLADESKAIKIITSEADTKGATGGTTTP